MLVGAKGPPLACLTLNAAVTNDTRNPFNSQIMAKHKRIMGKDINQSTDMTSFRSLKHCVKIRTSSFLLR